MKKTVRVDFKDLKKIKTKKIDFTDSFYIENLNPERVTSTRNVKLFFEYLHNIDINPKELYRDFKHSFDFLTSSQGWISLEDFFEIWRIYSNHVNKFNPRTFQKIGISLVDRQSIGPFTDTFVKLLSCNIFLRAVPMVERSLNNDTLQCSFGIRKISKRPLKYEAYIKFKYFANYAKTMFFSHECYVAGFYQGGPLMLRLPAAQIDVIHSGYDLLRLLRVDYGYADLVVKKEGRYVYANGEKVAETVGIKIAPNKSSILCEPQKADFVGYKATKSLYDNNGEPIILQGEVFNAPYSLWRFVFTDHPVSRVIFERARNALKPSTRRLQGELILSRESAYEALEAKKIAEMERNRAVEARKESERQLKITEIYTGKSLVEIIKKGNNPTKYQPRERELSVLFNDIRGFSNLSENMSPKKLIGFLNEYFEKMNAIILKNRGEIDKLIGDCIMAYFDDAHDAVSSAIEMQLALRELNKARKEKGLKEIASGNGIHFGKVVLGNIGSTNKMDYSIIGDTVNIAVRIESLTKYYGVGTIISEAVKKQLTGEREIRFIGKAVVKGKVKPIKIFEIYDHLPSSAKKDIKNNQNALDKAYKLYCGGDFAGGRRLYDELIRNTKQKGQYLDPVALFYRVRCDLMAKRLDLGMIKKREWSGVWDMEER